MQRNLFQTQRRTPSYYTDRHGLPYNAIHRYSYDHTIQQWAVAARKELID
jgi:hypothetical protein